MRTDVDWDCWLATPAGTWWLCIVFTLLIRGSLVTRTGSYFFCRISNSSVIGGYHFSTMWGPIVISWLTTPMNTMAICTINLRIHQVTCTNLAIVSRPHIVVDELFFICEDPVHQQVCMQPRQPSTKGKHHKWWANDPRIKKHSSISGIPYGISKKYEASFVVFFP